MSGIDALPVAVEVDVSAALPGFSIVVIVNLAPANLRKEGAAFDLPIALGILAASGSLPPASLQDVGVVGELSLDGGLRGVRGALSMAEAARLGGLGRLVLPGKNAREAAAGGGIGVYGVGGLREAVEFLRSGRGAEPAEPWSENGEEPAAVEDFVDVAGQGYAKRALEVAAAGGHNVVTLGQIATHEPLEPVRYAGRGSGG